MLGVKLHDDFYFDNKAFETAGGVNVVMLEKYEIEIFEKCQHNLFVDEETYNNYLEHLYNVYGHDDEETDSDTEIWFRKFKDISNRSEFSLKLKVFQFIYFIFSDLFLFKIEYF